MLYDDTVCLSEVPMIHQVYLINNIGKEVFFVVNDTTTFHVLTLNTTFTFIQ